MIKRHLHIFECIYFSLFSITHVQQHDDGLSSRSGSVSFSRFLDLSWPYPFLYYLFLMSLTEFKSISKAELTFSDANALVSKNMKSFWLAIISPSSVSTSLKLGFYLTLSILFPTRMI